MALIRPQVYLGTKAPNFQALTSQGQLDFYEYKKNSWCLFFSHPADFTPICTTEIGALACLTDEFDQRNCKLLGLSTNNKQTHIEWIKDIEKITGAKIRFPIICDSDRKVSTIFGMIDLRNYDDEGKPIPVRSVYILDPLNIVRLIQIYPLSTGRNTAEMLRCVDSLQLVDKTKGLVATPINWIPGDDVVIMPDLSNEEVKQHFPNYRSIREYLRLTPVNPDDPLN